ncbi:MAG: stage III sporulation protein AF [Clostridia bacterium]
MMEQVMNWIKDIFLMILSLTFFEILVPDSEMEKYLKLIFSLIILLMILDPVIRYISD